MNDTHPYRAKIPPVIDVADHPLLPVMIPTYKFSDHLHKTLNRFTAQYPKSELIQIEAVDDFSGGMIWRIPLVN